MPLVADPTPALVQLRARGDADSIREATRLEREFEAANPDDFDLDAEERPIPEDGSAPDENGDGEVSPDSHTKDELVTLAQERGVEVSRDDTKAEIAAAINREV